MTAYNTLLKKKSNLKKIQRDIIVLINMCDDLCMLKNQKNNNQNKNVKKIYDDIIGFVKVSPENDNLIIYSWNGGLIVDTVYYANEYKQKIDKYINNDFKAMHYLIHNNGSLNTYVFEEDTNQVFQSITDT